MPRGSRKRRRSPAPEMHSRNRYKYSPPDFSLLASLYPSFHPYLIFPSGPDRPTIDFADFSATRELTRVLLFHDHGVNWWIPDGQLCPTIPNRSNYIHWIEDLLASDLIPSINVDSDKPVRGFDIGTGANCIYPLLGASLLGWSFVGSDVTEVALEWAKKNVDNNPHISHLIEIRAANKSEPSDDNSSANQVLVGMVKEGEIFDFCMCNPPFFESLTDAGLNPKTACGGTCKEMVCKGGEREFIGQIIEDSVSLNNSFRWFTSMVGRKANLKFLISKVREKGATIVKTTEFVQGHTARWGLAWSFLSPKTNLVSPKTPYKTNPSFMLEVTLSDEQAGVMFNNGSEKKELSFQVSVFEQIPGTILVKGSLLQKDSSLTGDFSRLFSQMEQKLKMEFLQKSKGS